MLSRAENGLAVTASGEYQQPSEQQNLVLEVNIITFTRKGR